MRQDCVNVFRTYLHKCIYDFRWEYHSGRSNRADTMAYRLSQFGGGCVRAWHFVHHHALTIVGCHFDCPFGSTGNAWVTRMLHAIAINITIWWYECFCILWGLTQDECSGADDTAPHLVRTIRAPGGETAATAWESIVVKSFASTALCFILKNKLWTI